MEREIWGLLDNSGLRCCDKQLNILNPRTKYA
jgi:hypothetical protein